MTVDMVLQNIKELCEKYHAEQIILFGSRAKGTALERSDIDIAVSGVDDFDSLLDAVDAIQTLYTIDLLNMDTCGNELILEDIKSMDANLRKDGNRLRVRWNLLRKHGNVTCRIRLFKWDKCKVQHYL